MILRVSSFIGVGLLLCASVAQAQMERLNGVAALVEDTPITVADVKMQTLRVEQELFAQFRNDPAMLQRSILEVRRTALDALIERQLILQDFEKQGYFLPESIIDERVQDRVREQFGDRLTLTKTLQAQGMTRAEYREDIRQQVIVDFLAGKNVNSATVISPYDIKNYYNDHLEDYQREERIRLRMIFIAATTGGIDFANKILREIRSKVEKGADFSDMACTYHQGSQRKQGGDWGWVDPTVLREDLSAIAFSMKEGELSQVISKEEGAYLMLVEEKQEAKPKPLVEVQAEIEKKLQAEERNRLRTKWISSLRKKSFVRYF